MTFDLLAKFRSVARYGVAVFLPALSCFSEGGTGAINCSTSEPFLQDGVWVVIVNCEGNLFTQQIIPLEHYVPPGGSCTNCTAMSPEECENHKRRILSDLDSLQPRIQEETANIQRQVAELSGMVNYLLFQAHSSTAALRAEGDQFVSSGVVIGEWGTTTDERISSIYSTPQSCYLLPNFSGNTSKIYGGMGGVGAVYNYYNDTVKGVTETVDQQIMTARNVLDNFQLDTSGLDEISEDMVALRTYVSNEIVCTACQGSSGGGGGDGGGGATEGCPCSEVLTHIKNIVRGMSNDVAFIRQKIEKWDKYFETFKYQMKVITDAVAPIGTNFVAAVALRDLDGQSFSWNDFNKRLWSDNSLTPFDFGEFSKLSWFSRVEYSLLNLMGVFNTTNEVSEIKQAKDRADEAVKGHLLDQSNITQSLDSLSGSSFDSIRDSFMSMFQQFSFFGSGRSSIEGVAVVRGDLSAFIDGLSDVSVQAFAGNQQLVQLSDRLILLIRYAFQLIYLAVFCFLAYVLVVFLYGRIAQLVMWICSFYASVFGS